MTLFFLMIIHWKSLGQVCIQYPEIEGNACTACVPAGWTGINSPDIGDPSGPPSCVVNSGVSGPSPSGNNFVSICTNNASYSEGMMTTISNLTPCQSYTFGIWWEETIWCDVWTTPGSLLITVQGEEFIFSDAPVWELAQVCFTAQSTSVEISVRALFTGNQHCLIVDGSPSCSELSTCPAPQPCCTLEVTADDSHEICPGTSINLNGNAQSPTGNLQVEWTSLPANGITFLSNPNILNPSFSFPPGDFEGETFNFLLTVTDDLCTKTKEVEVKVLKSELPTFDFSICELADPSVFPNLSINGYEGTWAGNFNFTALAGTIETYTFTLASSEENCIRDADFDIEIIEANTVLFDLETEFCANDDNAYILPSISDDFVNGSWNTNEFVPSSLGTGSFDFQFSPESQFCALPYIHSISIKTKPFFDTLLCNDDQNINLDPVSNNGIVGFWNPSVINPNEIINNEFVSTWNPIDPLLSCVTNVPVTFNLLQPTLLSFGLKDSLCLNSGIYNLPTESLEGVSGQWNIQNINTNLLPAGTINLTYISSEFCIEEYQTEIILNEQKTPIFNIKTNFCKSDTAFILPNISSDGIIGNWSNPIIDPSLIDSSFVSIFSPSNTYENCYLPVSVVFQISSTIIPTFNLPNTVCESEGLLIFPTTSLNGINGSWTKQAIDFSSINTDSVNNIFMPSNLGCGQPLEMKINIVKLENPAITSKNPTDCGRADGSIILTESISDKEFSLDGKTWQSNATFENLADGRYTIYQRSKMISSCMDSFEVELIAPSNPKIINLNVSNISNCKVDDGKVICSAEGENLEYSTDGITWQSSPIFENLGPNNYTLLVRNSDRINCVDQENFIIKDIEETIFVNVKISPLSDCGKEDGEIIISAIGEKLEYSIDGGFNFFLSPEFSKLKGGQYHIIIQSTSYVDCEVDTFVMVEAPMLPLDLMITKTEVSACDKDDGKLMISAKGNSLEYSINGGLTWTTDPNFEGLSANKYEVVVREKGQLNCSISETVILNASETPKLTNKTINQPSSCISNDASVFIEVSTLNVEYSIDGVNWQKSSQFNNLSEGSYTIFFRLINAALCGGETIVEIKNPPCPCSGLKVDFDETLVNCKDKFSGQIVINDITGFITSDAYDFKWENGSTNFLLSNLAEGWYSYSVNYNKNCNLKDSIFIGTLDPIQFGLLGFDVNCTSLGSIEVQNLFGGSGQFQFSKDAFTFQESSTFFNLTAKEYEVIVKDMLGCEGSRKISIEDDADLILDLPEIKPIKKGTSILLNPLLNQATIDSFEWSPKEFILNSGNLIAEVAPPVSTEYLLTIYFGECSETRSILVEVLADDKIFIPNILSINSANNNNKFYFFGSADNNIEIDYYKFFDRWGNLVYQIDSPEINNADDGWDGTMSGKLVEQGVYTYISEVKVNGEKKKIIGNLTVVK